MHMVRHYNIFLDSRHFFYDRFHGFSDFGQADTRADEDIGPYSDVP